MNLAALALAFAVAAPAAEVADAPAMHAPLTLRSKAALAPAVSARAAAAPFLVAPDGPELDLIPRPDPRHEHSQSSCSGERSLCYDSHSGRIVYKPARAFMPEIPGMQRENISVKRNRITFRYSFK